MTNEKKCLYAVAVERYRRGSLVAAGIRYMHADSIAHAKNQYCYAHPNRRTHRVISVGPVIGYYVDDKDGKELSV